MSDNSFYREIAQGLEEAIAFERGELPAQTVKMTKKYIAIPQWKPEEIKKLRIRCRMTQRTFAEFMGVSLKTVESWEGGRNHPNGSAARLMQVMERKNDVISDMM